MSGMRKGIRQVTKPLQNVDEALRELKSGTRPKGSDYREKSLKIHGHLCAWCGKEFPISALHLLTVHHKDGNPSNNPPDGSNWENLCVYCHDAEHSRELLGDFEAGTGAGKPVEKAKTSTGLGTFADLLKKAGKK